MNTEEIKGHIISTLLKIKESNGDISEILKSLSDNKELIEDFSKLDDHHKINLLVEILAIMRPNALDSSYELQCCNDVPVLAYDIANNIPITSDKRDALVFVCNIYKLEMAIAPSGVCKIDRNSKPVFDRSVLVKSRNAVANILDILLPNKGYGGILRREGELGQILAVADSYNAMTCVKNPSKLSPNKQNIVTFNGEEYIVSTKPGPLNSTIYSIRAHNRDITLDISPWNILKTPQQALFEVKRSFNSYISDTLEKTLNIAPNIGPEISR